MCAPPPAQVNIADDCGICQQKISGIPDSQRFSRKVLSESMTADDGDDMLAAFIKRTKDVLGATFIMMSYR